MTLPAGSWTSSPGSWSRTELWTDARVPVASSASLTGEAPPVLLVRGQAQMRCHFRGRSRGKCGFSLG